MSQTSRTARQTGFTLFELLGAIGAISVVLQFLPAVQKIGGVQTAPAQAIHASVKP